MINQTDKKSFPLFFITFLTSFFLGIFITLSFIWSQENKEINSWEEKTFITNVKKEDLDLNEFWEIYSIIKDDFYSFDSIKKEDLQNGMIKWLVDALGDKHSEFLTPVEKKQFDQVLSGDFEWIGAIVTKNEIGVQVERVMAGSPAKKSGILAWDIIIKAWEEDLGDKDLYNAIEFIKWPAWTEVNLTIIRDGEEDIIEKKVVREKIKIPSVESEILEDENIAIISLYMFGEDTYSDFNQALKEVKEKNIEGLIIDLRDNGGWYLQSAVEILSLLIEDKEILVETKYRDSLFNTKYHSINDGDIYKGKIVVLVNENSASASEITAWALSDYNKAIIVGKQTYGKGSVQEPFNIGKGWLLKLTIAQWYTPKGKSIEEEGIKPDIEISFQKEDFEDNYDRQKEEAKKILKNFMEKGVLQITVDQYKEKQNEK